MSDLKVREQSDSERYQQLLDDPQTARHLLLLLSEGKGDEQAFRKMQDRIAASKSASATPRPGEPAEPKEPLTP